MKPLDSATPTAINGHSPIEDLTAITRDMTSALRQCANSALTDDQRQHLATFAGTVTTSLSQIRDLFAPEPDPLPINQRVDLGTMSPPLQKTDQESTACWGPR